MHRRIQALQHRAADLRERDAIAIVSRGIELVSGQLRFLHVTTFYPPYNFGGDGIFVGHLARALAKAGHIVDVIHCVDSYNLLSDGQPGVAMPGHPNLNVFSLRSGFGWLSPLLSHQFGGPFLKRRAIDEFLRGRHYDVVHYHNISLFGPKILSWSPPAGASLKLYTMHEHWLVCPMHVLWKFEQRPCERPQCIRCELRAGRPPQLWRYFGLLERAARDIDLFLAPSRFTARMHSERGFRAQVAVLPPFVEWRESLAPAPASYPRPYFFFAGRLEKSKGPHVLVRLWERIEFADLLIAGEGREARALRVMAAANPRVKFLGALRQRDLMSYYSNAIACLVPSLTYETSSLVTMESFARGTPVIAHDLGALSEMIEESGGGILYRNDDQLYNAINRIGGSRQLRDELGRKGQEFASSRWSREAHLKRYFELIEEARARKAGAQSISSQA